jgi:hypothetical protein
MDWETSLRAILVVNIVKSGALQCSIRPLAVNTSCALPPPNAHNNQGFLRQKFDILILFSTSFWAAHVEKWPRQPKVRHVFDMAEGKFDMHAGSETCHCQSFARHCRQCIRTLDKGIHACPVWKWEVVFGYLYQDQLCADTCHISASLLMLQALQQCCFLSVFGISLQCSQNTEECSTSSADNDVELPQHDVDANRAPSGA